VRHLLQDMVTTGTTAVYTEAQVRERLTSGGAAVSCRFDILDKYLNVVTTAGTIQAVAATVSVDTSRELTGSLGMTMLPNQAMNFPFRYRVKPWFRMRMLDGGIVEWPLGVYVWNVPTRNDAGMPDETWDVTLADQLHTLQLASPGPLGYAAPKGAHISALIAQILGQLGLSTAGVLHTNAILDENVHWGLTSLSQQQAERLYQAELQHYNAEMKHWNAEMAAYRRAQANRANREKLDKAIYANQMKQYRRDLYIYRSHPHKGKHAPQHPHMKQEPPLAHAPKRPTKPKRPPRFAGKPTLSWLTILKVLHQRAGYSAPWFDMNGIYQARPQTAYESAAPAISFSDTQKGVIMTPIDVKDGLAHLCNRVICRSHTVNGFFDFQMADLNTVIPGHPLSQAQIGFYIDVLVHDQFATNSVQLLATATAELRRRLAAYQEVDVTTLPWPVSEVNDVVAIRYSTDAELSPAAGINFLETAWDLDLFTGAHQHTLARITPPTLSEDQ
jgi:hypothetical protein